ncbi:MAG: hypothetical protein JXL80_02565 [Planctomycetes bacterium]|nr:hypothetical protein [Planctomycetota bacterium]
MMTDRRVWVVYRGQAAPDHGPRPSGAFLSVAARGLNCGIRRSAMLSHTLTIVGILCSLGALVLLARLLSNADRLPPQYRPAVMLPVVLFAVAWGVVHLAEDIPEEKGPVSLVGESGHTSGAVDSLPEVPIPIFACGDTGSRADGPKIAVHGAVLKQADGSTSNAACRIAGQNRVQAGRVLLTFPRETTCPATAEVTFDFGGCKYMLEADISRQDLPDGKSIWTVDATRILSRP